MTSIQIKRSDKDISTLSDEGLKFGELLFASKESDGKHSTLAVGNNESVGEATYFEGHSNNDLLGHGAFHKDTILVDKELELLSTARISPVVVAPDIEAKDKKYWITTFDDSSSETNIKVHSNNGFGIYIDGNHVLHGGAWNDYAENRLSEHLKPGTVVCEVGDGTLKKSNERLQPLPNVISDTYGFIIGQDNLEYSPIAICGRVLVYVNCDVTVGDVLCADKDGFATVMTREEIMKYPDRILGIVSEIPSYDYWEKVEVNNRVWITLK